MTIPSNSSPPEDRQRTTMTKIIVLVLASLTLVGCAAENRRRLQWLLELLRLER